MRRRSNLPPGHTLFTPDGRVIRCPRRKRRDRGLEAAAIGRSFPAFLLSPLGAAALLLASSPATTTTIAPTGRRRRLRVGCRENRRPRPQGHSSPRRSHSSLQYHSSLSRLLSCRRCSPQCWPPRSQQRPGKVGGGPGKVCGVDEGDVGDAQQQPGGGGEEEAEQPVRRGERGMFNAGRQFRRGGRRARNPRNPRNPRRKPSEGILRVL